MVKKVKKRNQELYLVPKEEKKRVFASEEERQRWLRKQRIKDKIILTFVMVCFLATMIIILYCAICEFRGLPNPFKS